MSATNTTSGILGLTAQLAKCSPIRKNIGNLEGLQMLEILSPTEIVSKNKEMDTLTLQCSSNHTK